MDATGFEKAALLGNMVTMLLVPDRDTLPRQSSAQAPCPSLHAAELLFRGHLANSRIERLVVAGFDARLRLVTFREVEGERTSVGGLLHMSRAVLGNTDVSIMVVGHNHPTGVTTPSTADREATRRIAALCRLAGVRLTGHLLFAGEECLAIGLS